MIAISPVQRADMDAKHAASRPVPQKQPAARPRNFQPVLDLGNTIYFNFRGRPFGVPPVDYKLGHRVSALWLEAVSLGRNLTNDTLPRYSEILAELVPILWKHLRPVGKLRRVMKRCRLLRNPLIKATDAELVDLAGFFQARRMNSGVQFPPGVMRGSKTA